MTPAELATLRLHVASAPGLMERSSAELRELLAVFDAARDLLRGAALGDLPDNVIVVEADARALQAALRQAGAL